jgi:hypothetical protein
MPKAAGWSSAASAVHRDKMAVRHSANPRDLAIIKADDTGSSASNVHRDGSELALPGADQAFLQRQHLDEGRHRLRHGGVIGRPWRGRDAFVPDLAKTVALPADQMKRGLGRAGHDKRGDGEAAAATRAGRGRMIGLLRWLSCLLLSRA